MQYINIKPLILIPLILFFLPAFALYIPGFNGVYLFFYFTIYLCLIIFLLKDNNIFIKNLINIIKNTPLKYLTLTFILIIINSLFVALIGVSSFGQSIRSIIIRLFLAIIPIILFYCYTLTKYISLKKFIKIFLFLYWLNLIIGFIAYLGQFFDIEIINNIFDFFANARLLSEMHGDIQLIQVSNYEAFGLPRLDNLHEEPSYYAQFLFLFLPFAYSYGKTKVKIYKNIFLNLLIKKTLIPFTWLSLILTFSPIFLIFGILITIIYFYKEILYLIRKYFIFLTMVIFTILFLISRIDLSETYLSRILNVLTNIKSFDDFILVEPSLATRIVSYINTFCLFLKNFFVGVGIGNIPNLIDEQYLTSPVSLTPEIISKNNMLINTSKGFCNIGFIYAYLAENGIVITSILIFFYYKIIKYLNYFMKIFTSKQSYYTPYIIFLKFSFIAIIINSFYNLTPISVYLFFIISLIIHFCYMFKNSFKGEANDN